MSDFNHKRAAARMAVVVQKINERHATPAIEAHQSQSAAPESGVAMTRTSTTEADAGVIAVTEKMVEAACGAFWGLGWPHNLHVKTLARYRSLFRVVLTAALAAHSETTP